MGIHLFIYKFIQYLGLCVCLATLSGIVWPGNLYSCGFIVDPLVTFEFFSIFFQYPWMECLVGMCHFEFEL